MKKTVLLVLISKYADWEASFISTGIQWGFGMWESDYEIKVVGPQDEPIFSLGGLRVTPDYTIETAPADAVCTLLIGGTGWENPNLEKLLPLLEKSKDEGRLLGGICDGSVFLARHGFLNDVEHTSNDLKELQEKAGACYTGKDRYNSQVKSVQSGNIITASATGYVEFAKDVLAALRVAPPKVLEQWYQICKNGF